jgi:hypothetical protein
MKTHVFLLVVPLLFCSASSFAYNHSITVDLQNGNRECSYQYNYKPGLINICATQKDARCLWDFNVDVTLYNLRENYGEGYKFECSPTSEFSNEVLNMTVLNNTGFDP